MTKLLIKLFVKNSEDYTNPQVRKTYGNLASIIGIVCNIFLFATKYVIGIISGSIAISADAVNNLSDASSNIIALIGFKLSSKKPDKDHPYGHGRYEYLSGLCVCILILSMGVSLLKESFFKTISPQKVEFSITIVVILIISIVVKFWLAIFNSRIGKKIKSDTLMATSKDSQNDVLSTFIVLVSSVLCYATKMYRIDGIMGLVVAAIIILSGIDLVKETLSPLIGKAPDKEFANEIVKRVCSYDGVIGVHDLMIHDYGPGNCCVTIHVEFPDNMDVITAHDLVDNIEKDFINNLGILMTIHYDPVATNDKRIDELRTYLNGKVKEYDASLSLHDFRIVSGIDHINVVFDCVLPAGYTGSIDNLREYLVASSKEINDKYNAVIKFEQSYI